MDDVLQDAALTALRRLGDIRDAQAVGPWLRAVVHNGCRSLLRSATAREPGAWPELPADDNDPERWLEQHAQRDWVWRALEELTPTLRIPLILRYFTHSVTSSEQIAAICGIPPATARSRLSQARAKLADALAETADTAHDDIARRHRASLAEAQETIAVAERGSFENLVVNR